MTSDYSQFYSDKAEAIDTYWYDFTQIQFDWIMDRLKLIYKINDKFSVMDLGCGTGRLLSMIADYFPNAKLYGLDGTSEMVEFSQIRLKGRAVVKQADFEVDYLQNPYDVVISTTVLHHLAHYQTHVNMIRANCTHAFITEFAIDTWALRAANYWWSTTQSSHKQAWSSCDFHSLLTKNGFTISDKTILRPDRFWRLQAYYVTPKIS